MQDEPIKRGYKYRFYPTREQENLLLRTFGCVRLVYNKMLNVRQSVWTQEGRSVSYAETSRMLTQWKKSEELSFLNEVSSVPLQQATRHLQSAYVAFFDKRAGYPKYKSRKDKQSATFTRQGFRIKGRDVFLAKMSEPLNIVWSRDLPGKPTSVTVSLDRAGRWYIVFLVEEEIETLTENNAVIGLDLGVKDIATSTGEKITLPTVTKKERARLARAQKELARRQKGSKNRDKARKKVARLHAKIVDKRRDFAHKLSTTLIRDNQAIVVESLRPKQMSRKGGTSKRGLNRAIHDAAWSEFLSMLAYKADWYGREVISIDQWYPSTQLCSACGARTGPRGQHELNVRTWTCRECGSTHDRDINAARNILAAGLAATVCGDGRSLRHSSGMYQHLFKKQKD